MDLVSKLKAQRVFFETGITKEYDFRKQQLQKLQATVKKYEQEIFEALHTDLKKNPEECWITENGFFLSELKNALKKLSGWMQPERVRTNLVNLPSKSFIVAEPLGVVLIISPWNYPFQLLFTPLIGAMAAGNCVVLKSSEFAPATSAIMKKMIAETFDEQYILFTEGDGATVITEMMNNFVFDHVFYTGSTVVGKIIYQSAAKNLVPVTLELGGKSPCVVEAEVDIKVAAKRIAFPKFSNAGQMCVAPDYVLVHASQKEALVAELKKAIETFFKGDAENSYDYGKIINEKQFDRLVSYLSDGKILYGGKINRQKLFIEPTLIDNVNLDGGIMNDEIFGPLLPIISFTKMEEALQIIAKHKNPLAFYLFTNNKEKEKLWLQSVAFGGGCVNNASVHLVNHHLPFGGRGNSGIGKYHGSFSFDTFSHKKAVLKTPTWIDPAVKYPPYAGRLNIFKKIIG
ncbi:MAG: aldehyde dehydrogenase [Ferruginibacter sp.]